MLDAKGIVFYVDIAQYINIDEITALIRRGACLFSILILIFLIFCHIFRRNIFFRFVSKWLIKWFYKKFFRFFFYIYWYIRTRFRF